MRGDGTARPTDDAFAAGGTAREPSRSERIGVWASWIGLSLVWLVLFGGFVVLTALGVLRIGDRSSAMPLPLGVLLVSGWVAQGAAFLTLMFPRHLDDPSLRGIPTTARGAALARRAAGTWTVWWMLVGTLAGGIAMTAWLASSVASGELGLWDATSSGSRSVPIAIGIALGALTVVACAFGAIWNWPSAVRRRRERRGTG